MTLMGTEVLFEISDSPAPRRMRLCKMLKLPLSASAARQCTTNGNNTRPTSGTPMAALERAKASHKPDLGAQRESHEPAYESA
mmetsp:Transcript_36670/g.100888  ORF Transcript_36670/g.100888 Transcript_36670/m.100888 type:complete len:83 (-) Transcript_36670:2-250(-)